MNSVFDVVRSCSTFDNKFSSNMLSNVFTKLSMIYAFSARICNLLHVVRSKQNVSGFFSC